MFDMLTEDPRPARSWAGFAHAAPAQHQGPAGHRIARGTAGHGTCYTQPTPDAPSLRVRTTPFGDDFTDAIVATEVYRAHTQPHLYEGWQTDLIDDNWFDLIDGRRSIDCHTCRKARPIDDDSDTCPVCGTEA